MKLIYGALEPGSVLEPGTPPRTRLDNQSSLSYPHKDDQQAVEKHGSKIKKFER